MNRIRIFPILAASALAIAISNPALAKHDKADVNTFDLPDGTAADGHKVGEATLKRSKDGVRVEIDTTELGAGNAYTVWWIIFNNPDACDLDGVPGCQGNDLGAVEGSVMNATGRVADADGNAQFTAFLPVGFMHTEPPSGNIRQVFGPGLQNLKGAEIHVVIRCHGPWSGDFEQISTLFGDCVDPDAVSGCYDAQAAAFPRPKGKSKK